MLSGWKRYFCDQAVLKAHYNALEKCMIYLILTCERFTSGHRYIKQESVLPVQRLRMAQLQLV